MTKSVRDILEDLMHIRKQATHNMPIVDMLDILSNIKSKRWTAEDGLAACDVVDKLQAMGLDKDAEIIFRALDELTRLQEVIRDQKK